MPTAAPCVNHPGVSTRLACSSCDAPICPRCSHQAAVGQKCPACARVPRSARALGKPRHYVRAVAAGLAVAVLGGLALGQALALLRFGSLILSGVLGYGVGRGVVWGAQGQRQRPFPALAAVFAVAGVAVGLWSVTGTVLPRGGLILLAYPVAAWLAHRSAG